MRQSLRVRVVCASSASSFHRSVNVFYGCISPASTGFCTMAAATPAFFEYAAAVE